jgi:hypothetical protein
MSEQAPERVTVELGPFAARHLHGCADQRGATVAAAAARQLHDDALATAGQSVDAWLAENPEFLELAEAERNAALDA